MARRLTRAFFDRAPEELAPDLLNKLLVSRRDDVELVARIFEVEAYSGSSDPASHAFRGQTRRNTTMFGHPGHLYVYFTYGMHFCVNVVARSPRGDAGAVLLRAVRDDRLGSASHPAKATAPHLRPSLADHERS